MENEHVNDYLRGFHRPHVQQQNETIELDGSLIFILDDVPHEFQCIHEKAASSTHGHALHRTDPIAMRGISVKLACDVKRQVFRQFLCVLSDSEPLNRVRLKKS
jgi:hypothetical protein